MTRVAVRELAAVAPLEETTGELSLIAEICLRRVLEFWDAAPRSVTARQKRILRFLRSANLAEPNSMTVRTSTFSFLYSDEGQLTPHISITQFFNRLGNKVLETF